MSNNKTYTLDLTVMYNGTQKHIRDIKNFEIQGNTSGKVEIKEQYTKKESKSSIKANNASALEVSKKLGLTTSIIALIGIIVNAFQYLVT